MHQASIRHVRGAKWFEYPIDNAIPLFADGVVAWSLAGVAMALALSIKGKVPKDKDAE